MTRPSKGRRVRFAPQLEEVREYWPSAEEVTRPEAATAVGGGGSEPTAGSNDGGGKQGAAAAENGGGGQRQQTSRGAASRRRTSPHALRASPVKFAVEEAVEEGKAVEEGRRAAKCKRCGETIRKEEPRMVQWQKSMGRNGDHRYHVLCVPNDVMNIIAESAPTVHARLLEAQRARRAQREEERRNKEAKHGITKFFLRSATRKN